MKLSPQIKEETILNIFGIFFLSIGILAVLNSLYIENPNQILWMCYLSLLIMGIGILKRNTLLIMSQVYILTIPVIIWNIDFFYQLILQKPLWNITNYFFYESTINIGKIISLQHLFAVPIAIYTVYKIGRKRNDGWKLSFIQITLSFIAITLLTKKEENINCVFNPCINFYFKNAPYELTWFAIFFSIILITALIINNLPFLKINPKKT